MSRRRNAPPDNDARPGIANGYALEHLCWYVPDFSPLFRPFVLPPGPLAFWQISWRAVAAVAVALL